MRILAAKASVEYGQAFIKSLITLNGGGILAVITFIGALLSRGSDRAFEVFLNFSRSASFSIGLFALGLVLAVAVAGFSFRNFLLVRGSYIDEADMMLFLRSENEGRYRDEFLRNNKPKSESDDSGIRWTYWLSVSCGTLSLISFVCGVSKLAISLRVIGI